MIAGFFLGVIATAVVVWATARLASAARQVEERELADLDQAALDHGDGPDTTYWLGHEPISRREYYLFGGR